LIALTLTDKGQPSDVIGVTLSGRVADRITGLMVVKAVRGITLAWNEASAAVAGMPQSTIAAGCVTLSCYPIR